MTDAAAPEVTPAAMIAHATLPPLPVLDFTLYRNTLTDEQVTGIISRIVPEARFIIRYKCEDKRCGSVHEYAVTAKRHDEEGCGDGTAVLWLDDCVEMDGEKREDTVNAMGLRYDGKVSWFNRIAAIAKYGPEMLAMQDPIKGLIATGEMSEEERSTLSGLMGNLKA